MKFFIFLLIIACLLGGAMYYLYKGSQGNWIGFYYVDQEKRNDYEMSQVFADFSLCEKWMSEKASSIKKGKIECGRQCVPDQNRIYTCAEYAVYSTK